MPKPHAADSREVLSMGSALERFFDSWLMQAIAIVH